MPRLSSYIVRKNYTCILNTNLQFNLIQNRRFSKDPQKNGGTKNTNDNSYKSSVQSINDLNVRSLSNDGNDVTNNARDVVHNDISELQPYWASLEKRVLLRKSKSKDEISSGRFNKRESAWDAENV
jgi:hypothetical protein